MEGTERDHRLLCGMVGPVPIAVMHVNVRLANSTVKRRFQRTSWQILSRTKSQSSKNGKNTHVHTACTLREDGNF